MSRHKLSAQDRGLSLTTGEVHWSQILLGGMFLLVASLSPAQGPAPSSCGQTQHSNYSRTTPISVNSTLNELPRNGFVCYRFTVDSQVSSKDNNWMGGNLSKAVPFTPTYSEDSYETPNRALGVEQYIRHIPTAEPIIERIRQQAKAHPHLTRALSMFRPEL